MIRAMLAVGLAVSALFVGITAISESAQQTEPELNSTSANDSYDLATGVFGGVSGAAVPALVFGGVGAVIAIALGILLTAGRRGR